MALLDGTSKGGRTRQTERIFLVVVDSSEEMPVALRYASLRARATGGRVALFTAVEREGFGHWAAVDDLLEAEQREEAEALLSRYAEDAKAITGEAPVLYIRHGATRDALLGLLEEEPSISILVLAAGRGGRNPGPLISALTGKLHSRLNVPVTIVPGNLTDDDLEALSQAAT
ncbi:MAG: universal stress protein [Rhodospirillaceae bacterium]|nr:universal stress protein [Rhodospirillaceae bacterium]